jgi:hypothetical protein
MNSIKNGMLYLSTIAAMAFAKPALSQTMPEIMPSNYQVTEWYNSLKDSQMGAESKMNLEKLVELTNAASSSTFTVPDFNMDNIVYDPSIDVYFVELTEVGSGYGDFAAETKRKRDWSTTWRDTKLPEDILKWTISYNTGIPISDLVVVRGKNNEILDVLNTGEKTYRSSKHASNNGATYDNHERWMPAHKDESGNMVTGDTYKIPLYNVLVNILGYQLDGSSAQENMSNRNGSFEGEFRGRYSGNMGENNTNSQSGNVQSNLGYTISGGQAVSAKRAKSGKTIGFILQFNGKEHYGYGMELPRIIKFSRWPMSGISPVLVYSRFDRVDDFKNITSSSFLDQNSGITAISMKTEVGKKKIAYDVIDAGFNVNFKWWHAALRAAVPITREKTLEDIYRHTEFQDDAGNVYDPRDLPVEHKKIDEQYVKHVYFKIGVGSTLGPVKGTILFMPNIYKDCIAPGQVVTGSIEFNIGYFLK